jgi:putative peptide zinc metalloprotease protein
VTTTEQPSATTDALPKLADEVELIGEYKGSGYKETPYIAQRSDGQVVQLSELLYAVAKRSDGSHTHEQIAAEVGAELGKDVTADNVKFLVDEKIRPLGLLKLEDGSEPKLERVNPFLALKFRTGLISDGFVRAVTTVLRPLYWPPVMIAALAGFVAFDVWFFTQHGMGKGLHQLLYNPALLLLVFGLLVVATAFHEFGHATACHYGGAEPGKIGVGIYLVWPAFYTDVTDSYRLGRWGRLRVDLGGVYFNAIFILIEAALYFYTGFEALLIAILVQHLEMLHQFLPFVRLDGYYVVSDLVGVPDLFQRMGPILKSLIPGRKTDPSVKELKPRVRFTVTAWVLAVVPILMFNLGMIVLNAPRIFGTAWDSLAHQTGQLSAAFGDGKWFNVGAGAIQIMALALPVLGIFYMLVKLSKGLTQAGWRHTEGRPVLRTAYSTIGLAAVAFIGWVWMPNGDYQPIGPNETWTLQTGLASFRSAGSGKAGLVPADPVAAEDPLSGRPTEGGAPAMPGTSPADDGSSPMSSEDPGPDPLETGGPAPTSSPANGSSPVPTPAATAVLTDTPATPVPTP